MLLPDTVGTGGDSHTRFPIGISFPAGSGLVAFAAAMGAMPLDMPESVLVRFKGEMQPGITLRDLVNAIPYAAIQKGDLTVGKQGKKNVFSGRILEIEGLPDLKVEQAFELADASAERSAAACTVRLDKAPVIEYLNSNVVLLENMIENGYQDARTLQRRIDAMKAWLAKPELLAAGCRRGIRLRAGDRPRPDQGAAGGLPQRPGRHQAAVRRGRRQDRRGVHRQLHDQYRPLPRRRENARGRRPDPDHGYGWRRLPAWTKRELREEGVYGIFGRAGARMEMPGCSLCMGNQARVADSATVFSTSTRNFDNRMGKDARVLSRLGRTGRSVRAAGENSRRGGISGHGAGQNRAAGGQHLPLPQLQPDGRLCAARARSSRWSASCSKWSN